MKVRVDSEICEAQGKCVRTSPEVFELDDNDVLHIKMDVIPQELREKIKAAVVRCPRLALSIED